MNILPCPFCGKKPTAWQDEVYGPGGPVPTEFVISCCAQLRASTEKEAIKKWNTRKHVKRTPKRPKTSS
jgi:hypothetical protein